MTPNRTGLGTEWMCSVRSALRGIMLSSSFAALSLALSIVVANPAFGQDTPDVSMGMSPEATYHSGNFDFVDMSSGRLNIRIPLVTDHSQRGDLNFTYSLAFTSTGAWSEVQKPPYGFWFIEPPKYGLGGPAIVGNTLSSITYDAYHNQSDGYSARAYYVYEDGWGIGQQHPLGSTTAGFESIDGSGISSICTTNRSGIQFGCSIKDTNGNETSAGFGGTGTDTLGRSWTTSNSSDVTGCPTATGYPLPIKSIIWTIPGPSGGVRTFKFATPATTSIRRLTPGGPQNIPRRQLHSPASFCRTVQHGASTTITTARVTETS